MNKTLLLCVNILLLITFSFFLLLMMRSRPLNAPDATNRMLVVSTWTVSPLSFLVFFSGTLIIVPSSSFSRPYEKQSNMSVITTNVFLFVFSSSKDIIFLGMTQIGFLKSQIVILTNNFLFVKMHFMRFTCILLRFVSATGYKNLQMEL